MPKNKQSNNKQSNKAKTKSYANEVKKGVLTQNQVDKLPPALLDAIIKSKSKYSKKK